MKAPRNAYGAWKKRLVDAPVAPPSLVLPLTENPRCLWWAAKRAGITVLWRKRPDGWHVWRVN